ncbi:hypothetical protein FHX44_111520 [Pseudonocardia hierapolitana]|uniref:Uncharacterized protein n=1 Tax=Pseudonocardia hierapolitana TaxID=1128676 RepID=A0A561SLC1_9PSEU|nr:hypothetical protein [Pseudonocardia hierapolitana]TWF75636.1 hypothetical protein FHX44_111520 [Pseudonocardia hierapolitana]
MAAGDPHDLPIFTLADLPDRTHHVVLTPAHRWRVVIEWTVPTGKDILLETVLRLRRAGEQSSARISDLMQLPDDLVRHLLARVAAERMNIAPDGGTTSAGTRVAWVYRDIATSELWPQPADERPPLPVRFAGHIGSWAQGSAGRPVRVEGLLVTVDDRKPVAPTHVELARFSRASDDPHRRTVIVGSDESCLVASPVRSTSAGFVVETTLGTPQVGLSRRLMTLATEHRNIDHWLRKIPRSAPDLTLTEPLREAADELRDLLDELRRRAGPAPREISTATSHALLGSIEFTLRRLCDHLEYNTNRDANRPTAQPADGAAVARRLGLDDETFTQLVKAEPGSLDGTVNRLLAAERLMVSHPSSVLGRLARAASRWTRLAASRTDPPNSVIPLARDVVALCDEILQTSEVVDGREAG